MNTTETTKSREERALDLLAECHTMIGDLVRGWPVHELHRTPDGLLLEIRKLLPEVGPWDDDEGCDEPDDSMDGDHESALASAGFGTDEDYGGYGDAGDEF